MSRRPDHVNVRRQHPGDGTSTIEGPGPPEMIFRTGAPTDAVPSIRCMRIHNAAREEGRRDTQRILLSRAAPEGDIRGQPKRTPPISSDRPTTCGMRGLFVWNPARIQTGSTSSRTIAAQGETALSAAIPEGAATAANATMLTATSARTAPKGTPRPCRGQASRGARVVRRQTERTLLADTRKGSRPSLTDAGPVTIVLAAT